MNISDENSRIKRIIKASTFDDLLDVFDVLSSKIRSRNNKTSSDGEGFHFLERVEPVFTKEVTEEDPRTAFAVKALEVWAPVLDAESEVEQKERRKLIKKEWLPVCHACNIRTVQELLEVFFRTSPNDAIESFLSEVEERKAKRKASSDESNSN